MATRDLTAATFDETVKDGGIVLVADVLNADIIDNGRGQGRHRLHPADGA
jgi:hypothetical protein